MPCPSLTEATGGGATVRFQGSVAWVCAGGVSDSIRFGFGASFEKSIGAAREQPREETSKELVF